MGFLFQGNRNEFNPDLKACNMTQYQLMYHYHIHNKNEKYQI
jgi:hypothetical protein